MPIANPIVSGGAGPLAAEPPQSGNVADSLAGQPAPSSAPAGTVAGKIRLGGAVGNFAGQDVSLHVGTIVLIALGVVVLLHIGGFRFVVDAGVSRR